MILAAGLLVLAGLGLFVGGLATGTTSYYWGCVACCAAAAVLLIAVRLRPGSRVAPAAEEAPAKTVTAEAGTGAPAATGASAATAATSAAATTTTAADPAPPAAAADGARSAPTPDVAPSGEDPGEEDVEVTDLLMVVDLRDQVLVVDEHPRYHLADCRWLRGRATIPLPVAEARSDGFTPCGVCSPDRHLADLARARKAADKR